MSCSKHDDVTKQRRNRKARFENVKKQLQDVDLWRSAAAEFLATFIFLFIVCTTRMMPRIAASSVDVTIETASKERIDVTSHPIQISVGIALCYATLIQCFEHVSGGYMNPAVSVAMVIAGHVTVIKSIVYSIAQLTGAFSAVALCYGMIPGQVEHMNAVSRLNDNITSLQGFGFEILQTVILTVTWLATYATSRNQLGSSALPVGMAYLANSLWAGQLTGSSMNPARSLPPAILSCHWDNLWVYVAGPICGCLIGSVLYTQVLSTEPRKQRNRKLTGSGRTAEGESVQSEQDATEMTSLSNLMQRRYPVNSTNVTDNRDDVARNQPDQANSYYLQQIPQKSTSLAYMQQMTSSGHVHPQNNAIQRPILEHQTLPAGSSRKTIQNLQTTQYSIPRTPHSADVTLMRTNSRIIPRPNTACGTVMTYNGRINNSDVIARSRSQTNTPAAGFRSISVSGQFSESSDALINNSAL